MEILFPRTNCRRHWMYVKGHGRNVKIFGFSSTNKFDKKRTQKEVSGVVEKPTF